MRPIRKIVIPFLLMAAGCQHLSLRNHTERQARTLTDLQYDQVLANIAMFIENPNSLPFFSAAAAGQTSNNYTVNPTGGIQGGAISPALGSIPSFFGLTQLSAGLSGTTTSNEQWSTSSVLNPDVLILMQCIYRKTVGCTNCDPATERNLHLFFAGHPAFLEAMRPGWYGVGKKHDVSKCACHVQHCNHTYVWVNGENLDYLSRLTMAILDLATALPPFAIPDPVGLGIDLARYNQLAAMAKDLSQILQQANPSGANDAVSRLPGYLAIQKDLNNVMIALSIVIEHKDAEEVLGQETIPLLHHFAELDANKKITGFKAQIVHVPLTDEVRIPVRNLLKSIPPSLSGIQFRPRKEMFFPQPNLSPPFQPSR